MVRHLRYRYLTDLPDGTVARDYGYDLVDLGPYRAAVDALPAGQRALVWIGGYSLADFVLKSGSMYDGSHTKFSRTRTLTARTVRLEPGGKEPVGVEVDGERIGHLPATFTILPGALKLVS